MSSQTRLLGRFAWLAATSRELATELNDRVGPPAGRLADVNKRSTRNMKKILYTALFGACAAPAFAADVGVSISVGQPGFYGQLDIGNVPQPQLVYPQPVVIQRSPAFVSAPPIYLHVPPGHET